jgi:hypothetical protein
MNRKITRNLTISLIVLALFGANVSTASANVTPTTFAVALPGLASTTVQSHSTSASTTTETSSPIFIAQSSSGLSTLAQIKITNTLAGLALKDADGRITLIPSSLTADYDELYPTDRGLVLTRGSTYYYISATSIASGASVTTLGSTAAAASGYAREVMSITPVDGGVYVSTFDTQLGTTEPELGSSHVWFLEAGKAPVQSISISGGYIASLSLTPGSSTTGQALVVGLTNRTTSDLMPITVNASHSISVVGLPAGHELDNDVIDHYLAWGLNGSAYVPLVVEVRTDSTDITDQSRNVLATFDADTNLLLAPNTAPFKHTTALANPILTSIVFPRSITATYVYGKKVTATSLVNKAGFGYSFSEPGTINLVAGGKTVALPAAGLVVKTNFCIVSTVAATSFTTAATKSVCAKVGHSFVAKVSKKKVTITTTATKVTVQLKVVKGKKISWAATKVTVAVKKGKATVTFKTKGIYRFIAAATTTNAAVTSGDINIK